MAVVEEWNILVILDLWVKEVAVWLSKLNGWIAQLGGLSGLMGVLPHTSLYSSPVFTLPSSTFDENPLPLDHSHFAFVLCFYDKTSSEKQKCGENATIGVNYEVLSANVKRPAGLLLLSDPRVAADLVYTVSDCVFTGLDLSLTFNSLQSLITLNQTR